MILLFRLQCSPCLFHQKHVGLTAVIVPITTKVVSSNPKWFGNKHCFCRKSSGIHWNLTRGIMFTLISEEECFWWKLGLGCFNNISVISRLSVILWRKPTSLSLVTDKLYHIILHRVNLSFSQAILNYLSSVKISKSLLG
jgi:hypothetical protein